MPPGSLGPGCRAGVLLPVGMWSRRGATCPSYPQAGRRGRPRLAFARRAPSVGRWCMVRPAIRIIVGLVVFLAILQGLAADAVPGGIVPLALVVLGLAYAAVAIDAEDATAYLVVALAVGAAAGADVAGPHPSDWRSPGRHRRSNQYSSVCRGHNRAREEDVQPSTSSPDCVPPAVCGASRERAFPGQGKTTMHQQGHPGLSRLIPD